MTPGSYNFPVFPGADISFNVATTGLDLTGFTARAKMRPTWPSAFVLDLQVAIVPVLTNWRLDVFAPASATTGMERPRESPPSASCSYYWDLEIVSPAGLVSRLLQGSNDVRPEATR